MIDKTICGNGTCRHGASGHYCACHAGFTNYGNNEFRCTGKHTEALKFFQHTLLNQCLFSYGCCTNRTFSWVQVSSSYVYVMVINKHFQWNKSPVSSELKCDAIKDTVMFTVTPHNKQLYHNLTYTIMSITSYFGFILSKSLSPRNFPVNMVIWCGSKISVWNLQRMRIQHWTLLKRTY